MRSEVVARAIAVSFALALVSLDTLNAQSSQQDPLPSGAAVVARYVAATHVDSLILKRHSVRLKYTLHAAALTTPGTVELIRARPNLTMQVTNMPGRPESRRGFDGKHAWEVSASRGARLLDSLESSVAREEADFAFVLRDSARFPVRETIELAEFGGQKCYKVRLVTKAGRESFECYSVETGLLTAVQRKVATPLGQVDELSLFSEYVEHGGALFASKRVVEALGQRATTTLVSVELDSVLPAEFALPAPIKALVKE